MTIHEAQCYTPAAFSTRAVHLRIFAANLSLDQWASPKGIVMKRLALQLSLPAVALTVALAVALTGLPAIGGTRGVHSKSASAAPATSPEVLKVEPPTWWAGHSIGTEPNPVRLFVRGRNLAGAAAIPVRPGLKLRNLKINAAGTYLLADLVISKTANPGAYPIRLTTAGGSVEANFEIAPALPRAGNFQGFDERDVIYLLMPDRFANGDASNDDPIVSKGLYDRSKGRRYHGGDLQGVINHLPYLKDLGVTAIWLNPVYDNHNQLDTKEVYDNEPTTGYHGYGAVDFYAVEEHFGDLKKFRELVETAHKLGLKIIQDQVANHTGPYHPWVKDPPAPDWFNGTEADHLNENWQTHLVMDRHATPALLKPVLDGWFVNILPDLNQNNPDVARYIIQNTLWWVGMTGLDAIRQDTLPYVPREFWREWMTAIKREYPKVNVVGETLDGLPAQVAFFQGGATHLGVDSKIDAEFDYPLYFAIRRVFGEGQSMRQLVEILNQDYLYPAPEKLVTLLGSHDVQRFMNEKGATVEGLKLAFTFLLTTRGIPQLYYGDEIAMRGGNDPDNRRDFPGGWPGDLRNAFEASGRTAEENDLFEHVRKLLKMRRENIASHRLNHLFIGDQAYAFRLTPSGDYGSDAIVVVAINNASQPVTLEFPRDAEIWEGKKDLLGKADDLVVEGEKIKITLPARSAAIYK